MSIRDCHRGTWYYRIRRWLEFKGNYRLEIGPRSLAWRLNMVSDLKRWEFPVELRSENNMCWFVRKNK